MQLWRRNTRLLSERRGGRGGSESKSTTTGRNKSRVQVQVKSRSSRFFLATLAEAALENTVVCLAVWENNISIIRLPNRGVKLVRVGDSSDRLLCYSFCGS